VAKDKAEKKKIQDYADGAAAFAATQVKKSTKSSASGFWSSGASKPLGAGALALSLALGRGLNSSTFQLNMSCFLHTIPLKHPLVPPNTPQTPPEQPLSALLSHRKRLR